MSLLAFFERCFSYISVATSTAGMSISSGRVIVGLFRKNFFAFGSPCSASAINKRIDSKSFPDSPIHTANSYLLLSSHDANCLSPGTDSEHDKSNIQIGNKQNFTSFDLSRTASCWVSITVIGCRLPIFFGVSNLIWVVIYHLTLFRRSTSYLFNLATSISFWIICVRRVDEPSVTIVYLGSYSSDFDT
jgi:hypothetical protein